MINQTKYVLGFAFNECKNCVILIEKQKPEFLKGKLNGLGGKIEGCELPNSAMSREFKEECGIETSPSDWNRFSVLDGPDFLVYVFKTTLKDELFLSAKQTEKEKIFLLPISILKKKKCVSNIHWLIEMALDESSEFIGSVIDYK